MTKRIKKSAGRSDKRIIVGHRVFAAISAVEGLELSPQGRRRVENSAPSERRRAEVIRAYMSVEGSK